MYYPFVCVRHGVPYINPASGVPILVDGKTPFLSSDCILLREEVLQLILSLGLVQIGSDDQIAFQKAMDRSEFSRYHFCDQWKDDQKRKLAYQRSLCQELYLRNRPRSRYVRSSANNHSSRH